MKVKLRRFELRCPMKKFSTGNQSYALACYVEKRPKWKKHFLRSLELRKVKKSTHFRRFTISQQT